jgi:hypothetical protein
MHSDPGIGALSPFIATKLRDVADRHENDDEWAMVEITHKLPEWMKHNPGSSSETIPLQDILEALEISDEHDRIIAYDSDREMDLSA